MISGQETIRRRLGHLRGRIVGEAIPRRYGEDRPLRSELFSLEQLERHAKVLAKWHEVDPKPGRDKLLPRLAENESILLDVHDMLEEASVANLRVSPAGIWLLDNFYRVEEEIRIARRHLPKDYSRELPHLLKGSQVGLPRVYDLARELILHLDGMVDEESLSRFVASYQSVRVLSIGELWAIPIMLRLALIENLRRVSIQVALDRQDRNLADKWSNILIDASERDPSGMISDVARLAKSDPPMSSAFVTEIARRLQVQSPTLALPLRWIEQRLSEEGTTIEEQILLEVQTEAADRVSISNSLSSFKFLDIMDWRKFVESMSSVEEMLRRDPADAYADMDFATRDRYRHVVESIARRSPFSEGEVAGIAIVMAVRASEANGPKDRSAHVGYYLVGKGLPELQRATQMRFSWKDFPELCRRPLLCYLGAIALLTFVLGYAIIANVYALGLRGWALAPVALLLAISISSLSIYLVNLMATILVRPRPLPRMDLDEGIPYNLSTLVVVPSLLTGEGKVRSLIEGLETKYLANREDNLSFGLLTDLPDASDEHLPGEDRVVSLLKEGIEELNLLYPSGRFFLFHRPRSWNSQEKAWMGRERKRGAIEDLNSMLLSGQDDGFSVVVGDPREIRGVKYVITLDEDTWLTQGSARKLVATMAHPLNRPVYDESRQCFVDGYTILQPRLTLTMLEARRSWFARIFGGDPGLDPYTREVSDVYQDLFGEGSFTGKGIYDLEAFSKALGGRLPENLILSHDLLEGCYSRAALVSDVQLYEEFPYRYIADASRRHRWIRGDWQISIWLMGKVPGPNSSDQVNPISGLSKWKILDNLRRSVVPIAQFLLLILGWAAMPAPLFWTVLIAEVYLFPSFLSFLLDALRKPAELPLYLHMRPAFHSLGRQLAQAALLLAFLPFEAMLSLDAILRSGARMLLTHRRLLEWRTAKESLSTANGGLAGFFFYMWIGPVAAILVGIYLALRRPDALYASLPLLGLWLLSPVLAWWISQPLTAPSAQLEEGQREFLRVLARRTWRFFETFVSPSDNWLPPDNYQEEPRSVIANGTSPTNMGLSLLANLAAYDFGYISARAMVERVSRSLQVMSGLDRFRDHFYNWYDTKHLLPMEPRYISTVDSGNLIGLLMVLRQGLLELPNQRVIQKEAFSGIADGLRILLDTCRGECPGECPGECRGDDNGQIAGPEVISGLEHILSKLQSTPSSLSDAWSLLEHLAGDMQEIAPGLENADGEALLWARALDSQVRGFLDDISHLVQCISLAREPSDLWTFSPSGLTDQAELLRESLLELDKIPSLSEVAGLFQSLEPVIGSLLGDQDLSEEGRALLDRLQRHLYAASDYAAEIIASSKSMATQCTEISGADFGFLYDGRRKLLSIGYSATELRLDGSFYDLLASEARLSSYVAIARGELPPEHWFALGRQITTISDGDPVLLSWGGTMFEYLMPALVMPSFDGTLLDRTCKVAVERQIEYGSQRKVPWGVSESGYSITDANLIYQYRAFGVPGLGFKRGLVDDLVIAPYASALALIVAPVKACENLMELASQGFLGKYGFYEAIDYTPSRLSKGSSNAVVRSFMAHHQGMTFLSLAYLLLDRPMQRRFLRDPNLKAAELLLHERVPKAAPFFPHAAEVSGAIWRAGMADKVEEVRSFPGTTPMPEVHLLSNGRYSVMVTNTGGGYSRWKGLALTRWQADQTRDDYGFFVYLRDLESGEFWSSGYQPALGSPQICQAVFLGSFAELWRRDDRVDVRTEIYVSPEDDVEMRRVSITNRSSARRIIELTSYAEVVLASPASDATHPAFSNLFVQTEVLKDSRAILCTRRPRSRDEPMPWMFHMATSEGEEVGAVSYETNRLKFLGRDRTASNPRAMTDLSDLSGMEGPVLDPIVSIRCAFSIDPGETVRMNFIMGAADARDEAIGLIEKYRDRHMAGRVSSLAWTHGQAVLQQLNATEAEVGLYESLAGAVIYSSPRWRASQDLLISNLAGQPGLWGYGISGDLPIVLLMISDESGIDLVRQLLKAHAYWRMMGLDVDLVIMHQEGSGYRQALHDQIMGLIASSTESGLLDRPGGIFVRRSEQVSPESKGLVQAVARAIISDESGSLEEQLNSRWRPEVKVPQLRPTRPAHAEIPPIRTVEGKDLAFFNGMGGFTLDGREYIVRLGPDGETPAPWSNVLSNQGFGTVITESGASYTWSENAHEFRISPWYNDPVTGASGEAMYIRDDDSGRFWSPFALPARGAMPYSCRHGFGYSVFEHTEQGIRSELWVYVALDAPVKFSVLKVRNDSDRPRRLSATAYVELVLGELRSKSSMHVITDIDRRTGALFARNPYNGEFPGRVAFLDVNDQSRTFTGDRTEFLGRNGRLASPAALGRTRLSGRSGAAMDPCLAMQVHFDLAEGEEREIVFTLGAGHDASEARGLVQRFRGSGPARAALEAVWGYWNRTLGSIYLETPDKALNVLANGWLVYQVLSCRIWARSGLYQSSGAFGFRDQLQDVSALLYSQPGIAREHILLCASHQFLEGDVQHWWHPPLGRGVRTRISDDYLWLPFVVSRYVEVTGDTGVLDEQVCFLEGRSVRPDEESYYDLPRCSEHSGTLYEHCVRAVKRGLSWGEHGLPLMGTGDWNDGMNRVGHLGKGESVWLGFFLYSVLTRFSSIAAMKGDGAFAELCTSQAMYLRQKIEESGWDGEWYLRAYFDDGEPLGSASNSECKIDSISQSWAVLSGAGDLKRSLSAMNAVNSNLVQKEGALIKLLDPPFDRSHLDPGYIKGYVPGVRENGGQYTHAAVWTVMAFAALGDARRAWELFSMINPVNHGSDPVSAQVYRVEPYVVAADVYSRPPHLGQGGWSWYTGGAGWMYRLIIEHLLGLKIEADSLKFSPCLPPDWKDLKVHYRYRETFYHIALTRVGPGMAVVSLVADGMEVAKKSLMLVDDRRDHHVELKFG